MQHVQGGLDAAIVAVLGGGNAELFERPGAASRALRAQGVQVTEEQCRAAGGAVCRYTVSWR